MAEKLTTVDLVWKIAAPIAEELGLEIWDIRYVKEGADWYLRVFIDREDGITIEDCENMSRALDEPLDVADPIPVAYILEVSSPGLERELLRPEHFEKTLGQSVIVRLFRPLNGKKEYTGTLLEFENGTFRFEDDASGEVLTVAKKEASAVLRNDFDL